MPGFLKGLDEDIGRDLICKFKNLWIYGSAGADKESFSEEAAFMTGIGMTVCCRRLEEYQRNAGLSAAVDRILDMAGHPSLISEHDLFVLHKMLKADTDGEEPVGAWKDETNGTWTDEDGNRNIYCEYALPEDVPCLMSKWIVLLNHFNMITRSQEEAVFAYAALHLSFVRIHPFCDGNGRMARLLANLPVMRAGFPPILVPEEKRKEYIRDLAGYKQAAGCPHRNSCLLPCNAHLKVFVTFCCSLWDESLDLLHKARERQEARTQRKKALSPVLRSLSPSLRMG
ncbi:MAG: Fic family protein [Desulfobacterales bacterium]